MTAARLSRRGLAAATAAFSIWGLFPVYLHPLSGVGAIQVIAHRVTWSCLFLLGWMLARGELGRLSATLTNARLLALSALLISCNWLVYVWSVTHAHIVDTSLGYYINPLMNVVLGVFVLRERLNRMQWIAVAYLLWCQAAGSGAFAGAGAGVAALLVGSGLVTAVPLFLFAFGARALPYSTVGVLQYIAPSLQLLCGVLLFHESFGPGLAAGFAVIWAALLVYAADGLWRGRAAAARA